MTQTKEANNAANMSTVYLLTLVPFIMVLGNSMLIPVLPAIQKASTSTCSKQVY